MNDTDVQATNTDYKPKLHKNYKLVLQIWLVNNNVVPGSTKMLIQEHVALGKIRFCRTMQHWRTAEMWCHKWQLDRWNPYHQRNIKREKKSLTRWQTMHLHFFIRWQMTIICPGEHKEPENRLDKLNSIEPQPQKCPSIRCANHIFKEVVFIYLF